jgi:hypothetical protein
MTIPLTPRSAGGGQVLRLAASAWRLEIPAGTASAYRLAQLDDSSGLARGRFTHHGSFALEVQARASARGLPGTWGFGFWNEPFGFGLGQGGGLRLPALPNAAWFFHASAVNHLSLRDDLPARGFLAQVFHSPPVWPFLPFAPGLALLAWPAAARLLRRLARVFVREAGASLALDASEWHHYRIECEGGRTRFAVDGAGVLEAALAPRGRLGLVLWIDNQYAAFGPEGKIKAGEQENTQPAWIEIELTPAHG